LWQVSRYYENSSSLRWAHVEATHAARSKWYFRWLDRLFLHKRGVACGQRDGGGCLGCLHSQWGHKRLTLYRRVREYSFVWNILVLFLFLFLSISFTRAWARSPCCHSATSNFCGSCDGASDAKALCRVLLRRERTQGLEDWALFLVRK